MEIKMSMPELGKQLSNPEGKEGIEVAELMAKSNYSLYVTACDIMKEIEGSMLEIGPADGSFVQMLFDKIKLSAYTGVDISQTMIEQAMIKNASLVENGTAKFIHSDFSDMKAGDKFDVILTVNTIYFWEEFETGLEEIKFLLNDNAKILLVYRSGSTMKNLPFTAEGFNFFEKENVESALKNAGYNDINTLTTTEVVNSLTGDGIEFINHFTYATNS